MRHKKEDNREGEDEKIRAIHLLAEAKRGKAFADIFISPALAASPL